MKLRKHVNNTDVAIEIVKRFWVREKRIWKLKIKWWCISSRYPPRPLHVEQRMTLTEEQLREWKPYTFNPHSNSEVTKNCEVSDG